MAIFTSCTQYLKRSTSGFTLIELIVVIAMLALLFLGLVFSLNPVEQFNKAEDGQREHDLGQIQRALDSYFNDKGCYPTSLTFGSTWKSGSQVYMEKVPQDPGCSIDSARCYAYEVPSGTCPQWNILYAVLRSHETPSNPCPLETRSSCLPSGYGTNMYNYCSVSGVFDCSVVSASAIVSSGGGSFGSDNGGSGGSSTPTPTPILSCPGDQYYGCTGDNRCNSIAPKTQCTGLGGSTSCFCDQHCNQSCRYN